MDLNNNNWLATINILLGVVGFVWLLLRTTYRWHEYPKEIQMLLVVTLSFVFALLETSLEQILRDEDISFNAMVIFAVKAFLILTLFKTRHTLYRTGERKPGNGDSINPDRNVAASHQAPPLAGEAQPPALAPEEDDNDEALRRGPDHLA